MEQTRRGVTGSKKRKRYYLDTSSVRKLGSWFQRGRALHHVRTSAFTLVELLNGIDRSPEDYDRRASAIRRIMTSGIYIVWSLPQEITAETFSALDCKTSRIQPLKEVINTVGQSHSLSELLAEVSSQNLDYAMEYFKAYDDHIGNIRAEAADHERRSSFEREQLNPTSALPAEALCGTYADYLNYLLVQDPLLNYQMTVAAMAARNASDGYPRNLDSAAYKILESYNGKAHWLFKAWSVADLLWELNGGRVGRNDFF